MSTKAARPAALLGAGHPVPTASAVRDLAVVVALVWLAAFVVHRFDLPEALDAWNRAHPHWAIDEVTLVALCAVAGLGVFSWRRWQESMRTIARHEATLQQLRTSEGEIAAKDQLIRTVSHELRTPLTAMLGYAELLGEVGESGTDRAEMIGTILRQGRDLADIVEDLLTRAQSESNALSVVAVPVDLGANVAQVLEPWSGTDLVAVTGERAVALGDPARVRQIVRNLLSNADRYGAAPVRVTTGTGSGTAWVAVSDAGGGIPAGDQERMFHPYQRADSGASAPGGLGLGLAISRQLARLMGGDLTYRRDGTRSVFELSLPAADQVL